VSSLLEGWSSTSYFFILAYTLVFVIPD